MAGTQCQWYPSDMPAQLATHVIYACAGRGRASVAAAAPCLARPPQKKLKPTRSPTTWPCSFAYISSADYSLQTVEWDDVQLYAQTQALKQSNPSLKTLISIGGWSFRSGFQSANQPIYQSTC